MRPTFHAREWPMRADAPCDACGQRCDKHAWYGACPPAAVAHHHDAWGAQRIERFDVNGTLYTVEQVARALELADALPAHLDDLAERAGYECDPGWQDSVAEVRAFVEERTGGS